MLGPGMSHSFPPWCFLHRWPGPKSMPCWIRWWWWAMCRSNQWDFGRLPAETGGRSLEDSTEFSLFFGYKYRKKNWPVAILVCFAERDQHLPSCCPFAAVLCRDDRENPVWQVSHHETAVKLHLSLGPSMSSQACFKGKLSGDPNIWIWMVRTTLSRTAPSNALFLSDVYRHLLRIVKLKIS